MHHRNVCPCQYRSYGPYHNAFQQSAQIQQKLPRKKAKMFPLTLRSRGVKHTRADTVRQPQPRAPTWSYHRYLPLLSAAYYYCLLWTCSAMKTNSPRPCPITFGTIYFPVFFTLCDGFIYSINCGCHAAKWSYLPQKEKLPGLCCAVVCFVLCTQNKS